MTHTPQKLRMHVQPGHIAISAKLKNTQFHVSLKNLFTDVKFHTDPKLDFLLAYLSVVFLRAETLTDFKVEDLPQQEAPVVVIIERNVSTLAMYNDIQLVLYMKGFNTIPVGNTMELPMLLQQLSMGQIVHSPASTFRLNPKPPAEVQQQLLLNIPGLGPQKATKLLQTFGSVQRTAFATVEELLPVIGVSSAGQVHRYFNSPICK